MSKSKSEYLKEYYFKHRDQLKASHREYYFNNRKLAFEGEYLKGKRNGKVKEYYENGELMFEVEYLNGERNGKGKEYYYYGELKFEGEYLNGKKWNGKGREYNYKNGEIIFEEEDLKGKIKKNIWLSVEKGWEYKLIYG